MLTQNKEIVYLATPGQSTMDDAPAPISFAQPPDAQQLLQYATFGGFVASQKSSDVIENEQSSGPLIVGRGAHSSVNAVSVMIHIRSQGGCLNEQPIIYYSKIYSLYS